MEVPSSPSAAERAAAVAAFFNRLREAIDARGITQAELARRLGVSAATISEWLTRGRVPSVEAVLFLPSALGVSGHWLLSGEGPRDLPHASCGDPYQDGVHAALDEVTAAIAELQARHSTRVPPL